MLTEILRDELGWGSPNLEPQVRMLVRLLIAALLGGLLGINRQIEHKAAGLRTHMLVSLAAALFTVVPLLGGSHLDHVTRVIQGVAAGIGFLGGGTILQLSEQQKVKGLTTAAGIWLAAAVGVSAGAGWYAAATGTTLLALIILAPLQNWETWINHWRRKKRPPENPLPPV
jgi:putative Mg2+ transporter-C (MgtC) family protein